MWFPATVWEKRLCCLSVQERWALLQLKPARIWSLRSQKWNRLPLRTEKSLLVLVAEILKPTAARKGFVLSWVFLSRSTCFLFLPLPSPTPAPQEVRGELRDQTEAPWLLTASSNRSQVLMTRSSAFGLQLLLPEESSQVMLAYALEIMYNLLPPCLFPSPCFSYSSRCVCPKPPPVAQALLPCFQEATLDSELTSIPFTGHPVGVFHTMSAVCPNSLLMLCSQESLPTWRDCPLPTLLKTT